MTAAASPLMPIPNKGVMDVDAYVPGERKIAGLAKAYKLSSNESPLGPPPAAIKAYSQATADMMAHYPDGQAIELRRSIAETYDLQFDKIMCGNGSDELLGLIAHSYLGSGDDVIMTEHGFSVYEIQSRTAGANVIKVPEINCRIDVEALIRAVTPKTRLVFIANPGNPTGTLLSSQEINRLHAALPAHVLLVLDAAYAEFVESQDYEPGNKLVEMHENVVMTRTFSKIYGLAGLRIGWLYAPDGIIAALDRVRQPFNVTLPAQMAAATAMRERDFIVQAREFNTKWRDWLAQELEKLGLCVTPSVTNFLLIHFDRHVPDQAVKADSFLKSRGFILRRVANYGFPNALRLSIGSEEANRGVIAAFTDFVKTNIKNDA